MSQLRKEARIFEEVYNSSHCCSRHNGYTPNEITANYPISYLDKNFRPPSKWPWPKDGKIHFIRFIRSDKKLRIFADEFRLKSELTYEYVKATIDIKERALFIYFQDELIQSFKYSSIPKTKKGSIIPTKNESNLCGAT